MEYQVLSRKYRPQKFDEIVGQSHIVSTLIKSIELTRVAHGYLLSGLRGSGKTTIARVLSKTLNCLNKDANNPCDKCQNCIEIKESRSLDVIELDGASNRGIDEIREIKEIVQYPPISSTYKIFIIDEVHMLTKEAFNALLKTLEEPPPNVIFILATTDPYKIPDTILSRVLRFDFKKITNNDISNHMKNILNQENVKYEDAALDVIAYKADGSIRDALSVLDKVIAYSDSNISYDLVKESLGIIEDEVYLKLFNYILENSHDNLLNELKDIIDSGYSIDNFIAGFNDFLSHSLIFLSGYTKNQVINEQTKKWLNNHKDQITNVYIMKIIDYIQEYELKAKYLLQPDIALESLFIKLSSINQNPNNQNTSNLSEDRKELSEEKNDSDKNVKEVVVESKAEIKKEEKVLSDEKDIDNLSKDDKNEKSEELDPIKHWDKIVRVIDEKDSRLSSFLEDVVLKLKDNLLIIELDDSSNEFIDKTLNNNLEVISSAICKITNHKYQIEIDSNMAINKEDDTQEHPLLKSIKEKFDGDTIR